MYLNLQLEIMAILRVHFSVVELVDSDRDVAIVMMMTFPSRSRGASVLRPLKRAVAAVFLGCERMKQLPAVRDSSGDLCLK